MSRLEPHLLEPDHYPMQTEIGLRYSDLDVNRHLNNVALIDILQEGRGYFHRASGMVLATREFTLMVANLSVQFIGEGFYGQPIHCHTGLLSLGRTSQTIGQLAMQGGRPVAFAETVMVTILDGQPIPHPDDYRAQMQPWLIRR